MPKVSPLGTDVMKKSMLAKKRADDEFREPASIKKRIDALQVLAGFRTQEEFARALNMPLRRIRYIRQYPERCTMKEGICIQTLARQYDMNVFSINI